MLLCMVVLMLLLFLVLLVRYVFNSIPAVVDWNFLFDYSVLFMSYNLLIYFWNGSDTCHLYIGLQWLCSYVQISFLGTLISKLKDNMPLIWLFVMVCKMLVNVQMHQRLWLFMCFRFWALKEWNYSNRILLYGFSLADIDCIEFFLLEFRKQGSGASTSFIAKGICFTNV